MNRQSLIILTSLLLCSWLVGCTLAPVTVDWRARYAAKLGQPLTTLNEAALDRSFQDNNGNLTRLTWAQLADGTTVLLGLPAHGNPVDQVIDRTVILTQAEWQNACQKAIDQEVYGWSWIMADDTVGNSFTVHPTLDANATILPEPATPYCQFVYTPNGWELLIVESQGIIKAE